MSACLRRTGLLVLAGILVLAALTACGSGGSTSQTHAPHASLPTPASMPTPSSATKNYSSSQAPPAAVQGDDSGGAQGGPTTTEPYWASDQRHYVQINGTWYYDYYLGAHLDTNGQPAVGQYGVFNASTHQETYVFDTNLSGFTAFRALTSPLFTSEVLHWAAWPSGQTATDTNLSYMVTIDGGTLAWYTQAQLLTIIKAGLGNRIGLGGQQATHDWGVWSNDVTNTNGVLFGGQLNHTWVQPNCSEGCTSY